MSPRMFIIQTRYKLDFQRVKYYILQTYFIHLLNIVTDIFDGSNQPLRPGSFFPILCRYVWCKTEVLSD